MDELGGDNPGFSRLKERRALSFDFHRHVSFEDVEQFLGSGVHVPRSGGAGPEFDNADDGLLDQLTLILQVFSQDLGQLRLAREKGAKIVPCSRDYIPKASPELDERDLTVVDLD